MCARATVQKMLWALHDHPTVDYICSQEQMGAEVNIKTRFQLDQRDSPTPEPVRTRIDRSKKRHEIISRREEERKINPPKAEDPKPSFKKAKYYPPKARPCANRATVAKSPIRQNVTKRPSDALR